VEGRKSTNGLVELWSAAARRRFFPRDATRDPAWSVPFVFNQSGGVPPHSQNLTTD